MNSLEGTRPTAKLSYAIPAILVAAVIYALMSALVKIEVGHLSVPVIMFWRYLVSLLLYLPWLAWLAREKQIVLKTEHLKHNYLRVAASLGSVFFYFISLQKLSVASANLLFNTFPIMVPIVAYFWKGIKIYHRIWWGLGVAFIGLILAINPEGKVLELASLLSILSGIFAAISLLSLRFAHYHEPSYRMNFNFFALALLMSAPLTVVTWKTSWLTLQWSDALPLLGIGVCGFIFQLSSTFASKYAPIRYLGPFLYLSVICGIFLDRWIWKTSISPWMIYGMILIILGNLLVVLLYPRKAL